MKQVKIKSAVISEPDRLDLETQTLDFDEKNEVLIRSLCTGISAGTELGGYHPVDPEILEGKAWIKYPYQPGYSGVGLVETNAENGKSKRVYFQTPHTEASKVSREKLDELVDIPDNVSDEAASMLKMVAISSSILGSLDGAEGDLVLILGLGFIGNVAMQLIKSRGFRVIGFDPISSRREIARHVGLEVPEVEDKDAFELWWNEEFSNRAPDIAIDAVGHSAIVMECLEKVRPRGRVVMLGTPKAPQEDNVTRWLQLIHRKPITLCSARLDESEGQAFYADLLSKMEQNLIQIDPLLSHSCHPHEIEDTFKGLLFNKEEYFAATVRWKNRN